MNDRTLGRLIAEAYVKLNSEEEFDSGIDAVLEENNKRGTLICGVDSPNEKGVDWFTEVDDKRNDFYLMGAMIIALRKLNEE